MQIIGACTLKITYDKFDKRPMTIGRRMHKLTYLINNITYIWSSKSEILKGINNLPVSWGIIIQRREAKKQLWRGGNKCVYRFTGRHTGSMNDIKGIFMLCKHKSHRGVFDFNYQKIVHKASKLNKWIKCLTITELLLVNKRSFTYTSK
jgi:hypothetical protein